MKGVRGERGLIIIDESEVLDGYMAITRYDFLGFRDHDYDDD